jgi:ribose transport system ATP-binding protein
MEEILGVSDRIAVMREGQITGILTRDKFEEEAVMRLAVGQTSRAGNKDN